MNAAVSVVIPTYNRSLLATRAIRSVLTDTREGDEILVIDDGSTDDTEAVVRSFGEPVRYHKIQNSGPGAARNTGIRLAQNDLIGFLDSDDEFCPGKLVLQRQVMEKYPELVFSFTNAIWRERNGVLKPDLIAMYKDNDNIGSPFPSKHPREFIGPAIAYSSVCALPEGIPDFNIHVGKFGREMMEADYVHSNCALVRRSKAGDALVYPEDTRLMEDYEFMATLSRVGPVAYLDRDLAIQNDHEGPRLASAERIKQVNARLRVLERVWGTWPGMSADDRERYEALVRHFRFDRGKVLVHIGRLKEARADFDAVGASLPYRLFTRVPALIANPLYRAQLWLKMRLKSRP